MKELNVLIEEGFQCDTAVVGEPTDLQIVIAHKEIAWIEITIKGKASHASIPKEGINAIVNAARLVCALEEKLVPKFCGRRTNFSRPLYLQTRGDVQLIIVGAHYFVGDKLVQWDSIAATAMFTALPGLIFFSIAQRAIVKGLTAEAVKG